MEDEKYGPQSGTDREYTPRSDTQVNAREYQANQAGASQPTKFAGKPLGYPGVTLENVEHIFRYQPAQEDQLVAFDMVRESLTLAAKTILRVVPPCADRTTAIRKLREARMDANSAIALRGQI